MKVKLPRVRYHKEITEKELEFIIEDAACLYSLVSNYEAMKSMYAYTNKEMDESYLRMQSSVLVFAMRLYHFVSQLLDISELMKPMIIEVKHPGMTVENSKMIMNQVAKAYTHFSDGEHIIVIADLYRVLPMIAELLYCEVEDDEIFDTYKYTLDGLVQDYLENPSNSRLGELVDIGDRR